MCSPKKEMLSPNRHFFCFCCVTLQDQDWCRRSGDECAAIYEQDCTFSRQFRKASAKGAFTSSAKWFQSTMVLTKNDCLYCSVWLEGTRKHLVLLVTCESRMLLVMWSLSLGLCYDFIVTAVYWFSIIVTAVGLNGYKICWIDQT